jgi:hypothetical protein
MPKASDISSLPGNRLKWYAGNLSVGGYSKLNKKDLAKFVYENWESNLDGTLAEELVQHKKKKADGKEKAKEKQKITTDMKKWASELEGKDVEVMFRVVSHRSLGSDGEARYGHDHLKGVMKVTSCSGIQVKGVLQSIESRSEEAVENVGERRVPRIGDVLTFNHKKAEPRYSGLAPLMPRYTCVEFDDGYLETPYDKLYKKAGKWHY